MIKDVAWTGGKPTIDWKNSTNRSILRSPFCYRPTDPIDAAKHHKGLITRPERVKILAHDENTPVSSFAHFCGALSEHAKGHGLDTIFYVPHGKTLAMISVLESHNLFPDFASFSTALASTTIHWDEYEKANDRACCELLKNCIDEDLNKELRLYPDDTKHAAGIITFLRDRRQHAGAALWENKRNDEFKKLSPESYPGFDIEKYCADVLALYQELNGAHNWQTPLTLSFLNHLIQVPVQGFTHPFHTMQRSLNRFVSTSAHLSYDDALLSAGTQGYDIPSLCRKATSHYRLLLTNNNWPPAKNAFDKGTVPEGNAAQLDLENTIAKLLDSRLSKFVAANTPNTGSTNSSDRPNSSNNNADSNRNNSWRVTEKPGPNAPHTKLVNGKVYNFCNKCKRGQGFWTTTHTAAEHRGYYTGPANSTGNTPSNSNQSSSTTEGNAVVFQDMFRF